MMSPKSKTIQLIIALLLVGGGVVVLSSLKTGDDAMRAPQKVTYTDVKNINENLDQLSVDKTYEEGKHVIAGALMVPTPCHEIETNVTIAESYPEQVEVRINVVDTQGVCAQVLTEKEFTVEIQASELARIRGYVNDNPVEFVD